MKKTLLAALVSPILLLTTFSSSTFAGVVIVEPDNFAAGTDLTNAIQGITLSSVGPHTSVVIAADGFSPFNNTNIATTGSRVFGQSPPPPNANFGQPAWSVELNLLRVDFAQATDFVQIDLIYRDDDVGSLRAFDVGGNLLEEVFGSGDGRTADAFDTVTINRISPDIAWVTAGAVPGEGNFLDNLQFNRIEVPEPTTIALFAIGLAGLGFARRRKA